MSGRRGGRERAAREVSHASSLAIFVEHSAVGPSQQPILKWQRGHWSVACRHSISVPQRQHGSDTGRRGGGRGEWISGSITSAGGHAEPADGTSEVIRAQSKATTRFELVYEALQASA